VPPGELRATHFANKPTPQRATNMENAVISPDRNQRMFGGKLHSYNKRLNKNNQNEHLLQTNLKIARG